MKTAKSYHRFDFAATGGEVNLDDLPRLLPGISRLAVALLRSRARGEDSPHAALPASALAPFDLTLPDVRQLLTEGLVTVLPLPLGEGCGDGSIKPFPSAPAYAYPGQGEGGLKVNSRSTRTNNRSAIVRKVAGSLREPSADRNYVDAYAATLLLERTARSQIASTASDETQTKNATIPRKAAPKSLVASAHKVALRTAAETISTAPPTAADPVVVDMRSLKRIYSGHSGTFHLLGPSGTAVYWRFDSTGYLRHVLAPVVHLQTSNGWLIYRSQDFNGRVYWAFADRESPWCDGVPVLYRTPAMQGWQRFEHEHREVPY